MSIEVENKKFTHSEKKNESEKSVIEILANIFTRLDSTTIQPNTDFPLGNFQLECNNSIDVKKNSAWKP